MGDNNRPYTVVLHAGSEDDSIGARPSESPGGEAKDVLGCEENGAETLGKARIRRRVRRPWAQRVLLGRIAVSVVTSARRSSERRNLDQMTGGSHYQR